MRFVGIDLAWGGRNPTGLCAVADGELVDVALRRTDDEILAWLAPHVDAPCVVGVDAPVILRNLLGARPCEREITRCLGRHHAGAYPSNLTRVPARAQALADALDLSTDPGFAPGAEVRRMVEVYPHAAMVALAGLERTWKYKAAKGRMPVQRHGAFASLAAFVEGLSAADPSLLVRTHPGWAPLVADATSATSGAV